SLMPRSSSAPVRSSVCSKPNSRMPLWSRALRSTSGPAATGSVTKVAPGTKRSSGAPVKTCTVTSPRSPCALPMRATTTCTGHSFRELMLSRDDPEPMRSLSQEVPETNKEVCRKMTPAYPLSGAISVLSHTVRVDDVDPHRLATREGAHHGTEGTGGAAGAADDPTEVVGMDPDLEDLAATQLLTPDGDILVVVDDALDQVLQRLVEHDQASAFASPDVSTTSALSALGSALSALGSALSALGSAFFFFAVVAPSLDSAMADLEATSKSAALSAFGSATRRVPSVPGRPLCFCQSPVIFSSAATCSVGCAPTPSQYSARSELISMSEGSWVGWYLPISSIARPSRLVRESMMTTR